MGIGNFFDNFISGLAFGMAVNNPFYGGMCCCGGGLGYGYGGSTEIIDFGTFANPFPNPFGNMNLSSTTQPISTLNDFGNPNYPSLDFSKVGETIWNNVMNPNSEYNKRMKEYYDNLNNNSAYNYQTTYQAYEMPFSQWFLPTQITFNGYMPTIQSSFYNPIQQAILQSTVPTAKVSDSAQNESLEPSVTDADANKNAGYDVSSLKNKWSKKKALPNAFYEKVVHISKKIKCDPNDLMGIMWFESGKTFSPSKTNHIGAVGLIQFMPDTARTLGTTSDKLKAMSAVEQLEYVEQYLVANKSAAGYRDNETLDRGTLYSLVFLPRRSKRTVLTSKGENYYEQNPILDHNKDGKITKADLNSVISAHMA